MYLNSWSRYLIVGLIGIAILMIAILGLHLFGPVVLQVGLYSQLLGALLGGSLAIISVNVPIRLGEEAEPWLGRERLAWTLIGVGAILWGVGECIFRYNLAHHLPSFPALSDWGYAALPPLAFLGLMLQPDSDSGRWRLLVLLDSLISMGAILSMAWFLLLGSVAQTPNQNNLAKFLLLYYPITDIALLSCVVFLILRGRGRVYESNARRVGLLLMGIGICAFAISDFAYNFQNNLGTYVDGTWADLGWPLGLMIIGMAAHLRRFVHSTPGDLVEERVRRRDDRASFGMVLLVPYLLLGLLLALLVFNGLSHDPVQVWNRPVLLFATIGVVALVIVRQLITQMENERLSRRQALSLARLAAANMRVEEQARSIVEHTAYLEDGLAHLKEVQAELANGNLRARARITSGNLVSLAGSLNLMADRLQRFDQVETYMQKLTRALQELSQAFEMYRSSGRFVFPPICHEFPEISRLLMSMGMKQVQQTGAIAQLSGSLPKVSPTRGQTGAIAQFSGSLPKVSPARPLSKPLAGRNPSRPLTGPLPGLPGSPQAERRQGGPSSAPDLRPDRTTTGHLRAISLSGGLAAPEPSEQEQLDFPPAAGRGDS